jgi:hypothetical protein
VTKLISLPQSVPDPESIRDYVTAHSPRYAALVVERRVDRHGLPSVTYATRVEVGAAEQGDATKRARKSAGPAFLIEARFAADRRC